MPSGTRVRAHALALYNADGPLGVNDLCKRHSMYVEFANGDLEGEALNSMRAGIGGKLYGSALYDVMFSGIVTKREDGINLYSVRIDEFKLLQPEPLEEYK